MFSKINNLETLVSEPETGQLAEGIELWWMRRRREREKERERERERERIMAKGGQPERTR
jgi:hypothetical protein